jgi:hypothetical protein
VRKGKDPFTARILDPDHRDPRAKQQRVDWQGYKRKALDVAKKVNAARSVGKIVDQFGKRDMGNMEFGSAVHNIRKTRGGKTPKFPAGKYVGPAMSAANLVRNGRGTPSQIMSAAEPFANYAGRNMLHYDLIKQGAKLLGYGRCCKRRRKS